MSERVMVRGVVYSRHRVGEGTWHRRSMPPDAQPGRRSAWPPTYPDGRLPEHELIGHEQARRIIESSLSRLDDLRMSDPPANL